ncbi:MAG: hypothetical protein U0V48_01520 [Anaerolineales bacterium]
MTRTTDADDRWVACAGELHRAGCVHREATSQGGRGDRRQDEFGEWANFRGKRSVSGWSSRGGLTRNPYALDRSACGSIRRIGREQSRRIYPLGRLAPKPTARLSAPREPNGIVGIKPTLGLLSRSGIIPIAHGQDTPVYDADGCRRRHFARGDGPGLTRATQPHVGARSGVCPITQIFWISSGLKGARIGVARNMAGTDPRVTKIFETCLDAMKHLGAVIVIADVKHFDKFSDSEMEVLHYEFKADLNKC